MPKLPLLSGRDVCAILARHGFAAVRQKGSHLTMQRVDDTGTTTVIVPMHDEIAIGTLASIIRQSGLGRDAFTG